MDTLENGGIMVMNDEAREIFYSHGCRVDKKTIDKITQFKYP